MHSPVSTRRGSLADLDALAPLFDAYRVFYGRNPDLGLARAFLSDRLQRDESVVFLAEEAGVAAGFSQLFPSFSSLSGRRIHILNDLFVAEDARRRGVATTLLNRAAAFARDDGAVRLTLATGVDNIAAQAVYAAAGWQRDDAFYTYTLTLAD